MKQFRDFCVRHAVLTCIIVEVLFMGLFQGAGFIIVKLVPVYGYLQQMSADGFGTILGVLLMLLFGYGRRLGTKKKGFFSGLLTGGYMIVISCIALVSNISMAADAGYRVAELGLILVFVVTMLLIGTTEEFIFRGVISNLIQDRFMKSAKGVWVSTLISGLLFGCMHFMNLLSGVPFVSTLVQVLIASGIGAALTAVYYRTDNIWVVVFLHALIDFGSLFVTGIYNAGNLVTAIGGYSYINLIALVPYVIVLLVLLRRSKVEEILAAR